MKNHAKRDLRKYNQKLVTLAVLLFGLIKIVLQTGLKKMEKEDALLSQIALYN
jgi:hypothetical protein